MIPTRDELIPTRATLLQRLKNWQDRSSWEEFIDIYGKLIYGVARKSGLTDVEAQDVVQETMISVARYIPTFKYDPSLGSFKRWLLNMARWRIIAQLRKRGTPDKWRPIPDDPITGTPMADAMIDPRRPPLDGLWEAEWERNLLDAAIAKVKRRVDPQKYQIFDLCVNKKMAPAKLAATYDISVGQVYLAKHRVAGMIKEEVKRLEKETT